MTARRGERGAASLLVTACVGLLLLVGSALAVVGAMVAAHRSAQAAADLAALSGAAAMGSGGDACATAGAVAQDNRARLVGCEVDNRVVTVEVEVSGPRWLGQDHDFTAEARAGPTGASAASS
ncbi:flp pilus-assembly TadE/G-like family protein [Nocardioides humilatus]|uniref:Flp pilus-assembly TadE/G-like family protein n=1 Tax=Nocardioides humilatus TaxID=2607660 RepID=A0A5B1LJC8_9ACTN|nr:Rv3654c family TadE-like protein [Nocardioides humilatus]KAA1420308.1 flp pilus-assembly TadE/G-like family protein [Nocardioides humilatus]